MQNMIYTFDKELQLKDAGLVAASAAAQVGGSNKILDLGDAVTRGDVLVDVSAIEVATGDEKYEICAQFSSSSTFASDVLQGSVLVLGAGTVNGGTAASTTGRYRLPVCNQVNTTIYRYMRLYTRVAGTIATGINYSAYMGKVFA